MHRDGTRGFTLIELLVVIAIIGVLSTVVLASLNTARLKSRDARRLTDMKQLQLALEMYNNNTGSYPTTAAGLAALQAAGHIPTVPTDPQGGAYTYFGITGAWPGASCTTAGQCNLYVLRSNTEANLNNPITGTVPAGGTNCSTVGPPTWAYCMRP